MFWKRRSNARNEGCGVRMIKISQETKSELFEALKKEKDPFGKDNSIEGILPFLNDIWDLYAMPSEDKKLKNAHEDILKHTVHNDDWDIDYLFKTRLRLFEVDDIFSRFLETIVNIKYRYNQDEIMKYVLLINSYIKKEKFILAVSDYDEDNPQYILQKIDDVELYDDIIKNRIPFFVEKNPKAKSNFYSSHSTPEKFPSFTLVFNSDWSDYSYMTIFSLFFYRNFDDFVYVGDTKITNGISRQVTNEMPSSFFTLSNNYCSLGQEYSFYEKLKIAVGSNFQSVLLALKDAAFFPDINDKFEKNSIFIKSLIRTDTAERVLRQVRHKIYGYDLTKLYNFKYTFTPKYSKDSLEVDFQFDKSEIIPTRIYAIIGKNGTGKTQLITQIPLDISYKKDDYFVPRPPLFSKVIAVSYSIFDDFEIPSKTSSFNYIYCGLQEIIDGKKEILTSKKQSLRFHKTWKKIKELKRMKRWRRILLNFLDLELVDKFIVEDVETDDLSVSLDEFNKVKNKLSSGQKITLYIISEIIAHIRLDSLILFDEPETHLHPNAVSQLMNVIYKLIEEFESYCIITTHSPLVIQEFLSKNVFILEREENIPSIRKIGVESFGENLTVLTEEVFGNREIKNHYEKVIDALVSKGHTYEEIKKMLVSDSIPLSLNLGLYIRSKVQNAKSDRV